MSKILVVGGAGYIGGYLTDVLAKHNEVTVYDNLLFESRFLKDVNFIFGDIRDTSKLKAIINTYDVIVWLAAMVGDGACKINESLTNELNFESVKWIVDNYSGKLVFSSTCSVYGMNNDLITEDAIPNPLSVYAVSKLLAEQYIINHHKNYLIFRLGTLYGIGDAHSRIRLDLVVNVLTKKALEGETLSVFGGEQWRPLLHVKDVAHAIEYGLNNNINGIYNLAACNKKIYEIADAIKIMIPTANVEHKNISFEDLRNYKVDTSKYKNLGWSPLFKLQDGIYELSKVFREKRIVNLNDPIYSNAQYIKNLEDKRI